MNKDNSGSLLSPESRGGDIAQQGFNYQNHLIAARIPQWLREDAFTEMIHEGHGDVEAKFFTPYGNRACEFVEYKKRTLTPGLLRDELERFQKMDEDAPGFYRRFVIVSEAESQQTAPVCNALVRLRGALPFYRSVQAIIASSISHFREICTRDPGLSLEQADFVWKKVDIETGVNDDEQWPRGIFTEKMKEYFPAFANLSGNDTDASYARLVHLLKTRRGTEIRRDEIEKVIWGKDPLGASGRSCVRVYTSYDLDVEPPQDGSIILDWERFFAGTTRRYPQPDDWQAVPVAQAASMREWILSNGHPRTLQISGSRRLSSSVLLGHTFSSVAGFTLLLPETTNNDATPHDCSFAWDQDFHPEQNASELAVAIGVQKDQLGQEVDQYLSKEGLHVSRLLLTHNEYLHSQSVIVDAARKAKAAMANYVSKCEAKRIHLFLATPSDLALFLGHYMNALCPVLCYEWIGPWAYSSTCLLEAG